MADGMREKTTNVGGVIKRIWYAMTGTTQGPELMSIDEAGNFKNTGTMTSTGVAGTGNRTVIASATGLHFTQGYQQLQTGYNASADATSTELGATNADSVNGGATYKWRNFIKGNATTGQKQWFQCYKNGGSAWEDVAWLSASGLGVKSFIGSGTRFVVADSAGETSTVYKNVSFEAIPSTGSAFANIHQITYAKLISVTFYNNANTNLQGIILVAATPTGISVINSTDNTGLGVTVQLSGGYLQMKTTSGTVTGSVNTLG